LAGSGFGGGVLIVIATFYENTWAPDPEVTFNVPPGFTQNWVILLEDRSSSVQLVWTGVGVVMPFFRKKTLIDVPSSGIVRLRDLSGLGGIYGETSVLWSDHSSTFVRNRGRAPKSTGATSYAAFSHGEEAPQGYLTAYQELDRREEPCASWECGSWRDDAALGAYIAARERGL
jgi:hypothetical protein